MKHALGRMAQVMPCATKGSGNQIACPVLEGRGGGAGGGLRGGGVGGGGGWVGGFSKDPYVLETVYGP